MVHLAPINFSIISPQCDEPHFLKSGWLVSDSKDSKIFEKIRIAKARKLHIVVLSLIIHYFICLGPSIVSFFGKNQ